MIALICDTQEREWTAFLSRWREVRLFPDGVEPAYYLRLGNSLDMALVAMDGARGMNWARKVKSEKPDLPVVWISEQAEFEPQSRRIRMDGFFSKPVDCARLEDLLTRILGPPGLASP